MQVFPCIAHIEKFAFVFTEFKLVLRNLVPLSHYGLSKVPFLLPVSQKWKLDAVKYILCIMKRIITITVIILFFFVLLFYVHGIF